MAAIRRCSRRGCENALGRTKGKYCSSCKKAERRRRHDRHVEQFGLPAELYWKLYEAQDGHCAIHGCRATGTTKFLSVEHDHKCDKGHDPHKKCCVYCVRGLTCAMHNGWLGKAGDDPLVFMSLYSYLTNPPARSILIGE